jgi:hypothetical protein
MSKTPILPLGLLLLLLAASPAQTLSLTTTFAGGNGQNGNMFDITNISAVPVTIVGFDQCYFGSGTTANYSIYRVTAGTTFLGNQTTPAAWTLVGSTTNVAHPTANVPVPIPIVVGVTIPPGATQGFYLTTDTDTVAYTNGTAVGNVFASDSFLQFREGVGNAFLFGTTFSPRVWNGIIHYSVGGSLTPQFQVNGVDASLSINGLQGTAFTKPVTTLCTGALFTASSAGNPLAWELAYNFAPTVSASSPGSFVTGGGQVVNLNLSAGVFFFNGGAIWNFLPYPGPFSIPVYAPGVVGTMSFQQINLAPALPDGAALSQAPQLNTVSVSLPALPLAGPTGDDTQVLFNIGCIQFFGRSFSTMSIQSNGRLMFGGGITTFTPTVAQFATDVPSFGIWTDLNPAVVVGPSTGSITMTAPTSTLLQVSYSNVAYFATTIPNNFQLTYDYQVGIASIVGLTGLGVGTGQMLIGISGGNAVMATNPGAVSFSLAGMPNFGITANGTDMIYMIGTQGSLTQGINRIDFFPNPYSNYDWISS